MLLSSVYRTCLHCTGGLGENQAIETLPVGRRIAFDYAKGRLWVICPRCAKWNLVPFDTRLESIDTCERLFRNTRLRFSTDNIGLARIPPGLDLIRIGTALRPEFAAWRYGDRFSRRRRRNMVIGGVAALAGIGAFIGVQALLGSVMFFGTGFELRKLPGKFRIAARLVPENGSAPLTLTREDVKQSRLQRVEGSAVTWGLSVPARTVQGSWAVREVSERVMLTDGDAVNALGTVLPVISGLAGSEQHVRAAVGLVERYGNLEALVTRAQRELSSVGPSLGRLALLGPESRLALEMLSHEQSERRWLEGELRLLERQWREADRLAAIADGLAIAEGIDQQLRSRAMVSGEH